MRAFIAILAIVCFGLTGCATFSDGLAAMRGEGGTIARVDGFPDAVARAQRLPPQPAPRWYGDFSHESADLIQFVDPERVLIGTVEVDAYLGRPQHDELVLYDARTGRKLWAAQRPALSDGEYRVLAAQPHVLVLGSNASSLHLVALERETGRTVWSVERPMPARLVPGVDRLHLLVPVAPEPDAPPGHAIETIELQSGRLLARHNLAPELVGSTPASVHRLEQDLVLAGRRLVRFSVQDGTPRWRAANTILERGKASVTVTPGGVLVHDASAAALHDPRDGRLAWEHAVSGESIKLVAEVGTDYLALVRAGAHGDSLRLLRLRDGKMAWERDVRGSLTSPVVQAHGELIFTTDESVMAVRMTDGRVRFTAALPEDFKLGSPRYAGNLGQPDVLCIEGRRLYVARERAGVIAYALSGGRYLWHQLLREPHPGASPYSAAAREAEMNFALQNYRHLGIAPPPLPAAIGYANAASPTTRMMLASAQGSYDQARRTGDTGKQLFALQRMEVAQRMEAFNQQMASTQALFGALMSLNIALARALEMEAVKGFAARNTMQLRAAFRRHQDSFQGGFHLSPFQTEHALGVTLVELESGKRRDMFFAPRITHVEELGMKLPTFRVSPDGRQLLLVGTGVHPAEFRPYVKWKWRLPRPALLSYDIGRLKFERVNAQAASERKEGMREFRRRAPLMLVNVAGSGELHRVEFLLAAGVDVNSRYPTGDTPLMAAALGDHAELVRLLLARGADPCLTNREGKRAADLTQSEEIRALLARPPDGAVIGRKGREPTVLEEREHCATPDGTTGG